MSEPFLAEIKIVGFNFPPRGWAFCDGQILPINQNQSLFSLLGTTYGGDGETSFALPDLRGRCATHRGSQITQGQSGGAESHTLNVSEMPIHQHQARARAVSASGRDPSGNVLARTLNLYADPGSTVDSGSGTVTASGGSQAHQNMQPYLALNFVIALQGLFPSRN